MKQLAETIFKIRQTIPTCNLAHYDAATRSMVETLATAPDRETELANWLWGRVQIMQTKDISLTPPALASIPGETPDQHLARCFDAGGYDSFPQEPKGWTEVI
jgi:hypothetical protein